MYFRKIFALFTIILDKQAISFLLICLIKIYNISIKISHSTLLLIKRVIKSVIKM